VPAGYAVALLRRDEDNSSPDTRTVNLGPGVSVRHADALASLFGFVGAATLRITPFGGQLLAVTRTYDDAPGGSYRQFIEGLPEDAAITFWVTARMIQLTQSIDRSGGFRTNIGLVSVSPVPIPVIVELYRADGTRVGDVTVSRRPFESVQRNEIYREVTSHPVVDGYAVVRTRAEDGKFFAYANVIDNRSNDPTYIPAR
jgi:hypothetical protein